MTATPLRAPLTTADARAVIAWQDNYPHDGEHNPIWAAEFDRWLAGVKAEAWDEGHKWTGYEPEASENPYRATSANAVPDRNEP